MRRNLTRTRRRPETLQKAPFPGYRPALMCMKGLYEGFDTALAVWKQRLLSRQVKGIVDAGVDETDLDIRTISKDTHGQQGLGPGA